MPLWKHFDQYIEVHILNKSARFPMDLRKVFAANVRRLRHARGLSQDDLAYEAEISRSYLSQLEKGVFYASLNIVGKLAAVLDVEPAELLRLPSTRRIRAK
jgi:transcriptional regulator with XRE-family HTH domain